MVLGLFSDMILLAAVSIYLATFVPGIRVTMDDVGLLHVLVLAACFSIVPADWRFRKRFQRRYDATHETAKQWVGSHFQVKGRRARRILGIVVVVFALTNGLLGSRMLSRGGPQIHDGNFAIMNHGRVVRMITEEEYHALQRGELRMCAAFWIVFSMVPVFYYFCVCPQLEKDLGH